MESANDNTNDNNSKTNDRPSLNISLVRQLVEVSMEDKVKKKIKDEALAATGELLRLFIVEARNRASIEAECETEGNVESDTQNDKALIRANHIAKIAAELLMDFS